MQRKKTNLPHWEKALLGVVLSLLLGLVSAAPTHADGLHTGDRWIVDEEGRRVVFHGVIIGNKHSPYLASIDEEDVAKLKRWGFNLVRLSVFWTALEPTPGNVNDHYLQALDEQIALLEQAGIRVLLEMHQDAYSEQYQGIGAPAWAGLDDGLAFSPARPWPLNYTTPAVTRAFDNFWDNEAAPDGVGLQDHFIAVWTRVATRYKDHPNVIGYDLLNEPFPGSHGFLRPEFDQLYLRPFYEKLISSMQATAPKQLYFYEPNAYKIYGAPSYLGKLGSPNLVYAFHTYCIYQFVGVGEAFCRRQTLKVLLSARLDAWRAGAASFLGEWGCTDALETIDLITTLADRLQVGWAYCSWQDPDDPEDPTSFSGAHLEYPDGTEKPKLDLLVRPYPRLIAGTPWNWSFDRTAREFELRYANDLDITAPTEIFLPAARHYPEGFDVEVRGGSWEFDADEEVLVIHNRKLAPSVSVVITPVEP